MAILDAYGRPVDTTSITKEQAGPSHTDQRSPTRTSVADAITPKRLGSILRMTDQGDVEAYLTLADEMEERDGHYFSVLGTRRQGVAGLPMKVESASDAPSDIAIADEVRALVKRPEFAGLVFDLTDALGKGFSVCEIGWQMRGRKKVPTSYTFRPQRWFQFDLASLSQIRLRSAGSQDGIELTPMRFAIHVPRLRSGTPIRMGLARVACLSYVMKRFTLADWMTFLEVFGMPLRIGKYDTSATPENRRKLLAAVRALGPEAAAILPKEMDVQIISSAAASGGDKVFLAMAEYLDKQVSKAVLGQTMTVEDGSSLAQAKVHDDVRIDLKESDSQQLAATLQRDVIDAYVALNFGPNVQPPQLVFHVAREEDQEKKARTYKVLADMGVPMEVSFLRDQFGVPEPADGAAVVGAARSGNPAPPAPSQADAATNPVRPSDDDAFTRHGCGHRHAFSERAGDSIDELRDGYLSAWRSMTSENVAYLEKRLRAANSFEEARRILDEEGPRVGIGALTEALARASFTARGLGDATDKPRV